MGRGPHYARHVRVTLDSLADDPKMTTAAALERLQQLFGDDVKDLHPRTVERWMLARRGEPGLPWSSADPADPADVAAVLEVLDGIMEKSPSASITVAEATRIMVIKRSVPAMPPVAVYGFAKDYLAAGDDVQHLDVSLSYARRVQPLPSGGFYMTPDAIAAHVKRHVDDWLPRPLTFWSGSIDGARTYVQELGRHASAITSADRHLYVAEEEADYTSYDEHGFGRLVISRRRLFS